MNMKKLHGTLIAFACISGLYAQDPEFTQFYASPVYTNPAMAGTAFCGRQSAGRYSINYRNQWPRLPGTFRTFNASYDQHYDKIGGGTIHQLKLIKILNIHDKEYHERVTIHPVFFKPTDEYLKMMNRENKLNNLGI